jgi:hypothetical protein
MKTRFKSVYYDPVGDIILIYSGESYMFKPRKGYVYLTDNAAIHCSYYHWKNFVYLGML